MRLPSRTSTPDPEKSLLNNFMSSNASLPGDRQDEFGSLFSRTVAAAFNSLGRDAFRPAKALNAAVYDACMVGLARRLENKESVDRSCVRAAYKSLINDTDFQRLYQRATADKDSVLNRIQFATDAFDAC